MVIRDLLFLYEHCIKFNFNLRKEKIKQKNVRTYFDERKQKTKISNSNMNTRTWKKKEKGDQRRNEMIQTNKIIFENK